MKIRKGLAMGIFSIVVAAAAYGLSFTQIGLGLYSPEDLSISPRAFPHFASILLGIFGICNIVRSLIFKKDETVTLELKREGKILLTLGALIVYLLIFNVLGFIISTILLSSFVLFMQGSKKWQYYVIVAVTTVLVFVAFKYGLNVTRLPWGYPLVWIFG